MHVSDAYKALNEKGKRRALRAIVALLTAERIPATQAEITPIVAGGEALNRLKTDEVARVISGVFRGQFSLEVGMGEVFGEATHAR